jgi:hypothetical protein
MASALSNRRRLPGFAFGVRKHRVENDNRQIEKQHGKPPLPQEVWFAETVLKSTIADWNVWLAAAQGDRSNGSLAPQRGD